MSIDNDIYKLKFSVCRSIRYHNMRRGFYDFLNSIVTAISVIMGSTAVYGVLGTQKGNIALVSAAIVTVFSTINLVFGTSIKARLHHDLSKRFIALEKKITMSTSPSESELAQWSADRLDIEAEEPPVLRVLDTICHNEQARAIGCKPETFIKITYFQRLLAPVMDFRAYTLGMDKEFKENHIYVTFIFVLGVLFGWFIARYFP